MKLNYVEKWTGTYRGVTFEINRLAHSDTAPKWFTYYLIIVKDRMMKKDYETLLLKKKKWRKRSFFPSSEMDNYFDFHGGCTYYAKIDGGLKIGCDYNHLHDEEMGHSLNSIVFDVRECIDKLLTKFTFLRWCGQCGKIAKLSDGKLQDSVNDEGAYNFICSACLDAGAREKGGCQ